jgi:hypothetical protein
LPLVIALAVPSVEAIWLRKPQPNTGIAVALCKESLAKSHGANLPVKVSSKTQPVVIELISTVMATQLGNFVQSAFFRVKHLPTQVF